MARHQTVYSKPHYYDIVFRRDVSRELDFLAAACATFAGHPPTAMVDLACGPGYHARASAARGLDAFGLDFSGEMVAYARSTAMEAPAPTFLRGDMRAFALPRKVDFAVCAYDSIDAMLTNDDMRQHFAAVAANLTDGGLYMIQCMHTRDCSPTNYGLYRHLGSTAEVSVELQIGVNRPTFHPVTGIGRVELQLRVVRDGQEEVIRDEAFERLYDPQLIELLAEGSQLRVAGWYGDFDLGVALDESSPEMLALLQKRPA